MLPTSRWARLAWRWLTGLVLLIVLAGASIAIALEVTPQQTVIVAGQVIQVGASTPSLSLSGPGEVDLFGQSLPTNVQFAGPVRPRLQLSAITINSELTTFVEGNHPVASERILGTRLADGWKHYFIWETVVTGLAALILVGAVAGWRRTTRRTTVKLLIAGLIVVEAINLGAIMSTAYTAPALLRRVHSLNDLVGTETRLPRIHAHRIAAAQGPGGRHGGLHGGRRRARADARRVEPPRGTAGAARTPTRPTCPPSTTGRSSTWPATAPRSPTGCSGRRRRAGRRSSRSSPSPNAPGRRRSSSSASAPTT